MGCSTKFKVKVAAKLGPSLRATGILMFWVLAIMVPVALVVGVVSGMREGSRLDRALSMISIATTSTPEYVSGVVLTIIFATWLGWLNGSAASATGTGITFYNFTLPVVTPAIYGMGYVARMTRASMIEVMNAQYIRTARLKGLGITYVLDNTASTLYREDPGYYDARTLALMSECLRRHGRVALSRGGFALHELL